MGFFDDLPAPEPEAPRRHHPWQPPEADFPGIVPIDTLLLGQTDQVAVAVTGLSAFPAGTEIFVTARIRPSADRPEEHLPGGPRDLAASRQSFRFGLQFADGGKAVGRAAAAGRTTIPSQPGRSCTRSPAAADHTLSFRGGGCGRCLLPGRWSSSASGRRSALPNRGPASTRSLSSRRHGVASGYGRKTKADGEILTASRHLTRTGARSHARRAPGAVRVLLTAQALPSTISNLFPSGSLTSNMGGTPGHRSRSPTSMPRCRMTVLLGLPFSARRQEPTEPDAGVGPGVRPGDQRDRGGRAGGAPVEPLR